MRKLLLVAVVCLAATPALAAYESVDTVVSVASTAGGSAVVAQNPNRTLVCLQNTETQIEYCATAANVPTSTVYGFSLAPASASGAADGPKTCFSMAEATIAVTCLAASGTGKIAVHTSTTSGGASTSSPAATASLAPGAATAANQVAAAASTPTTSAMPGHVVAQRPTTRATAPANTTLTAATATKVFSSTAGICQIACQNKDAVIHMSCGEDNTVSATVGLDVPPSAIYKEGPTYGGEVWCFPASGTPVVSCQPTACP